MKSKRIISGLLALTFVFGGIVVPSNVVNNSSIISASAGNLTRSGDFTYSLLNDGTYEIYDISTNLRNNVIHAVIPSEFNGKDVTSISKSVFNQCNFTSVEIPDTITKISYNSFYGCENLKSIVLPDSITEIEDSAFQNCKSLESVTLNEGLENIGAFAFQNCKKLKSIEIPSSVYSIGDKAFYDCEQLTKVHISEGKESLTIGFMTFYNCIKLTDINIPERVVHIGNYAFQSCTGLESISLPDSLKGLGYSAFCGCSSLNNVNIPKSLTAIPSGTFSDCTNLTNIKIPDNITKIESSAFSDCTGLSNIKIPDNVTKIESYAFSGCTGLSNIKIPDNVTKIESSTFSNCTGLTTVFIPEGVTAIGDSAFCGCTGLKYIWIPASVESIGDYAFSTKYKGEPLKNVTIFCYPNVSSCALEYAKAKGLKYKVIDKITTYPTGIKYTYNEQYHQVKFTWEPVANVQQYGVAIYLAGKWRVQTQDIPASTTSYTTPKNSVFSGSTYKVAVAARVNGKWDTANAIKHAVTIPINDSDHDDFLDFEDPDVNRYNYINIDDSLIDDTNSIYAKNPKITQSDLDKMIGHVTYRQVLSASRQNSFKKNELVFTRTRKKDYADGVFTLSPSKNSDFAFTITNPNAKMSGGKYSDDDYNMSVKIYYFNNDGDLEEVSPVDINISHNNTSTSKTYVYALEEGIGYIIYVNNETNNYVGEYEIHVSEDNWVYAPNGGIRTREFDILTDHNIEKEIFFSDNTFFILEKAFQGQTNELNQDDWKKEELLVNTSRSCETKWNNAVTVLSNFDNYVGDKSKSDLINKAIFGHDYTGDLLSATSILVTKFTPSDPVGIGISVAGIVYSMGDIYADYKNDKFKSDIVKAMLEGNYNISLFERSVYSKIDPLHITMKSHSVETWEYNHYINKYKDGQRFDVTPFNVYELTIDGDTYKLAPIIN